MRDWRGAVRERLDPLGLDPHQETDVVEELALELDERHGRAIREGQTVDEADALGSRELGSESFSAEIRGALLGGPHRATGLKRPAPPLAPGAGLTQAPGGVFRGFREDLKYAARLLVKNPVFTVAAVASLGLGVGANTTIFSLVNQVLLNPLPVQEPSRLVSVFTTDAKNRARFQGFMALSYPNF